MIRNRLKLVVSLFFVPFFIHGASEVTQWTDAIKQSGFLENPSVANLAMLNQMAHTSANRSQEQKSSIGKEKKDEHGIPQPAPQEEVIRQTYFRLQALKEKKRLKNILHPILHGRAEARESILSKAKETCINVGSALKEGDFSKAYKSFRDDKGLVHTGKMLVGSSNIILLWKVSRKFALSFRFLSRGRRRKRRLGFRESIS